jgi:phage tail protein X
VKVRAQQGDTVDSLCWRHYGTTRGMNELVLEANPGLAAIGAILPIGHEVELPERPPAAATQQITYLWD